MPILTSEVSAVQKCLECMLRILVNLTHANELWGRKVVQCEYGMNFLLRIIHNASQNMVQRRGDMVKVEEEEEDLEARNDKSVERAETCALDTLCLALGLLTNLAQAVKEVKEVVRETRMCFFLPNCLIAFVHVITDRSKPLLYSQEARMCSTMYLLSHL
jgi:hypothetical protein